MFELLSIVCTAAALAAQTSCVPDLGNSGGEATITLPDAYEAQVAPGMYQLSYAGSGHDFDGTALVGHWRRRAAQLCAGDYRGHPTTQVSYPEPGYDMMVSALPVSGSRTFNVETFGVAYCTDPTR